MLTFPATTFETRYGLGESTGPKKIEDLAILDRTVELSDALGGVAQGLRRRNTCSLPHLAPPVLTAPRN